MASGVIISSFFIVYATVTEYTLLLQGSSVHACMPKMPSTTLLKDCRSIIVAPFNFVIDTVSHAVRVKQKKIACNFCRLHEAGPWKESPVSPNSHILGL
jgi:hypothetical protein